MKIDKVVIARYWREAKWCFDDAVIRRKDDIKKAIVRPLCITWKDGTRTYYISRGYYDKWNRGRTYKIIGSEEIYHSGKVITKSDIRGNTE